MKIHTFDIKIIFFLLKISFMIHAPKKQYSGIFYKNSHSHIGISYLVKVYFAGVGSVSNKGNF